MKLVLLLGLVAMTQAGSYETGRMKFLKPVYVPVKSPVYYLKKGHFVHPKQHPGQYMQPYEHRQEGAYPRRPVMGYPVPAPMAYTPEPVVYASEPMAHRVSERMVYPPAPAYAPEPVSYAPEPIVYAPPPVYAPATVSYTPGQVTYAPRVVERYPMPASAPIQTLPTPSLPAPQGGMPGAITFEGIGAGQVIGTGITGFVGEGATQFTGQGDGFFIGDGSANFDGSGLVNIASTGQGWPVMGNWQDFTGTAGFAGQGAVVGVGTGQANFAGEGFGFAAGVGQTQIVGNGQINVNNNMPWLF